MKVPTGHKHLVYNNPPPHFACVDIGMSLGPYRLSRELHLLICWVRLKEKNKIITFVPKRKNQYCFLFLSKRSLETVEFNVFLKNNYPVYCRRKSIIGLLHRPRFTHMEFLISKKKFVKLNYIEMILKRPQRSNPNSVIPKLLSPSWLVAYTLAGFT